jgi:hypothetical protein
VHTNGVVSFEATRTQKSKNGEPSLKKAKRGREIIRRGIKYKSNEQFNTKAQAKEGE